MTISTILQVFLVVSRHGDEVGLLLICGHFVVISYRTCQLAQFQSYISNKKIIMRTTPLEDQWVKSFTTTHCIILSLVKWSRLGSHPNPNHLSNHSKGLSHLEVSGRMAQIETVKVQHVALINQLYPCQMNYQCHIILCNIGIITESFNFL